ncbi:MAG: MarR family winged helix-turn-helix transcriptional regulator [Arenicella sp.]
MFERCLYFNSNTLSRLTTKVWKKAYSKLGLSPAHAYLLRLVIEQPGLVQRDIALELNLEKSTLTRFIDKLVEEGYLKRTSPESGNHREQAIFPTQKTQDIADSLQSIGDDLYQKMQQAIGEQELRDLILNLRKINKLL